MPQTISSAAQFDAAATLKNLVDIVGKAHVLTHESDTRLYRQGRRFGQGQVFAVVTPGTLLQQWQVLQVAVAADSGACSAAGAVPCTGAAMRAVGTGVPMGMGSPTHSPGPDRLGLT